MLGSPIWVIVKAGLTEVACHFVEMATHFSILAWKIPWTEEPGGLYSTG